MLVTKLTLRWNGYATAVQVGSQNDSGYPPLATLARCTRLFMPMLACPIFAFSRAMATCFVDMKQAEAFALLRGPVPRGDAEDYQRESHRPVSG